MNKLSKIFLVIIIILLVILGIMTASYFNMKKIAVENFNQVLESAEEKMNLYKKISELEEKNNTTNMTMPNDNIVAVNNTVSQSEILEQRDNSIDINKVTIEVDKNSITPTSVSIIITNNNENELTYGEEFKIQKKVDGEWRDLNYLPNTIWNAMAYITKANSQTNKKLNIKNYYGELENGTYRVVKPVFDGNIYSDEFEIE